MTQPVALVTGSSKGLGRGLAARLLARGYTVVGCSRSAIEPLGQNYSHRIVDVADADAVRSLVDWIGSSLGRLDVVVNNAALGLAGFVTDASASDVEQLLRTNLLGPIVVCREAARLMMRQTSGRIINIASVAVPLQMEGSATYTASKAGVIQFTRVLARELAPFGITCNVVAPSFLDTEMTHSLKPVVVRRLLEALTIKRAATIDDVANAVWFFVSPESSYVTGQVLYLGLAA